MTLHTSRRRLAGAGIALSFSLAVSGCAGFGNLGNEPGVTTVTLASVIIAGWIAQKRLVTGLAMGAVK
jgi:ABC-type glycerol-3-phosphate transport system permease component